MFTQTQSKNNMIVTQVGCAGSEWVGEPYFVISFDSFLFQVFNNFVTVFQVAL